MGAGTYRLSEQGWHTRGSKGPDVVGGRGELMEKQPHSLNAQGSAVKAVVRGLGGTSPWASL